MIIELYPGLNVENNDEQCSREDFVQQVHIPTLEFFPAPDHTKPRPAIMICPGGGYQGIAIGHEGRDVARYFSNELGISAFVLKYRLPPTYRHPIPLQDTQRAMQLIRSRAKEWNINPKQLGAMGFSAGGHLASSLATAPEIGSEGNTLTPSTLGEGSSEPESAINKQGHAPLPGYRQRELGASSESPSRQSSRPNFAILIYPVISMHAPETHIGSRDNLLTPEATEAQRMAVSTELLVNRDTPPTFLLHAMDDPGVSPQNSIAFHAALQRSGVPAELHLIPSGGHGFGMRDPQLNEQWLTRLKWWLEKRKII